LTIHDDGTLILKVFDGGPSGPAGLGERMGRLNEPGKLTLEDGTTITTPLAHLTRRGNLKRRDGRSRGGAQVEFDSWQWLPHATDGLVFVAALPKLRGVPGDNLLLQKAEHVWCRGHFRGQGCFAWHLLDFDGDHFALAEPATGSIDADAMAGDLLALDFVAGEALDVSVMWAVNRDGAVVGAISTGRPEKDTHRRLSPVPTGNRVDSCWAAPFFRLLSERVAADQGPAVTTAIAGYKDGLRGHIHGEYLLGQVALEAFCRAVVSAAKVLPLLQSTEDWRAWLLPQETKIKSFASSDEDARVLWNRLNYNVIERPSGDRVKRAFSQWGIELPAPVLQEIGKRNPVAHDYLMFDEVSGDVQEAADRVDMIQMLLAGALAKHIGYGGPVVGWERDRYGHLKVPDFWPSESLKEADDCFVCRS
jgi:hypothetical protein